MQWINYTLIITTYYNIQSYKAENNSLHRSLFEQYCQLFLFIIT